MRLFDACNKLLLFFIFFILLDVDVDEKKCGCRSEGVGRAIGVQPADTARAGLLELEGQQQAPGNRKLIT